ncbi:MAG: ROK family protein [Anaerolineae bacterium]
MKPTNEMGANRAPYSQQREARQQNTSVLLRDLWQNGPLSRAMLAERSGLTKATVSAICQDLIALGLLQRAGKDRSGPGRPGQLIELDPKARCAIGVEVSTNYSAVVLVDLCGDGLWQRAVPHDVGSSQEEVLVQAEALIAEAIDQARERVALGSLLGIGVAVPGAVDPGEESFVTAPALGWKEVSLKQRFKRCFALPVIVDNRARAAAMAEALHGSAQGVANFVYVCIGTDVGASVEAAVVAEGTPYGGARGMAVDAGHMILDPNGPLCSCGQRGCWQAMADVGREVDLILPRLAAGEPSVLQRYASGDLSLDHRTIHQAARDGDPLALDVVRQVLSNHALGVTNLVRLFDPEMVVLGWASAALPEEYLVRMRTLVKVPVLDVPAAVLRHLAERGVAPPTIVRATYERDASALGAAALVVDDFLWQPLANEV